MRCLLMAVLFTALPAQAALNIFACTPEWGALAKELGGEKATVQHLSPIFATLAPGVGDVAPSKMRSEAASSAPGCRAGKTHCPYSTTFIAPG